MIKLSIQFFISSTSSLLSAFFSLSFSSVPLYRPLPPPYTLHSFHFFLLLLPSPPSVPHSRPAPSPSTLHLLSLLLFLLLLLFFRCSGFSPVEWESAPADDSRDDSLSSAYSHPLSPCSPRLRKIRHLVVIELVGWLVGRLVGGWVWLVGWMLD